MVSFIINAFLLLIGYKFLDKLTCIYTIIAVFFNSFFWHVTENWRIASDEVVINAVFGGILAGAGIGIGMILKVGGTTAGTTILASIANKYLDWNVSFSLLFFDLVVALSSYFIIGAEKLMIIIVMLYIATKVMGFLIEGLNPKKAVMIVSAKQSEIAERVNAEMDRGVTVMYGRGFYTQDAKEILYIVISKQEMVTLKKDVFGKGFLELSK